MSKTDLQITNYKLQITKRITTLLKGFQPRDFFSKFGPKSCCRSEIYFVLLSSGKANLRSQEEKPGTRKVQVRVGLQNQGAEEANRTARK